jgi:pyruvate dehydrogenase E2 component (dihydrolipoamide acetyltransferase)
MYESLANTAQLTLHTSADARRMMATRKIVKAKMDEGYPYNITINDMVSYATIRALIKNPEINIHFMGDSIRSFSNVHLGFAVDTARGLMVPTVQSANHLTIEGLSTRIKELASACQNGNIDPELFKGATFTMTNLGGFGIEMFTPVLNPPQVGILGINTITQQPAQLEGGAFGFIPKIGLSLTFDHRALDGAPAARFLQDVVSEIEGIEWSN